MTLRTCVGISLAALLAAPLCAQMGQQANPGAAPLPSPQQQNDEVQRRFSQQLELLRHGGPYGTGPVSPTVLNPQLAKPIPSQPADAAAPTSQPAAANPPVAQPVPAVDTGHYRPSLLDEPASPPKLALADGLLTVSSSNSSLNTVLHDIAAQTGMQIEGLQHDQRIFGTYGPGTPAEVLSSLLYDSGYNVIMLGAQGDAAPVRLVLSARSSAPAGQGYTPSPERQRDEEDDDNDTPPSPAALFNPRINQPSQPPTNLNQPRTPQQMLEELQRLRQGQNNTPAASQQVPAQPANQP